MESHIYHLTNCLWVACRLTILRHKTFRSRIHSYYCILHYNAPIILYYIHYNIQALYFLFRCALDLKNASQGLFLSGSINFVLCACAAFGGLGKMGREKSISIATKMKLYYALVVPVLVYGSECWSLRKEDERRLLVAEMSWLRRIIGRSRREKVRNEQTRKELGAEETVVQKIKKRDYSGLDTWKGWRRKDYQMQLYMDM